MATLLTVQTDMAAPTFASCDNSGNSFDNSSGQVYFWVENGTGGSITVTVAEKRTCNFGHTAQDFVAIILDGATTAYGPFDLLRFNDSSRRVNVTYSNGPSSLKVAAVEG
jgi:hypothetical protein